MSASAQVASVQGEAQRRARIDLAACHRLAAHFGFNEGIDNHMTMLVPGFTDRFYLAPFGLLWSEVKASDLLEVDFAGKLLAGRGLVEDTALYIHASTHRLSSRVCVLHTHMPYATALTMVEGGELAPAHQNSLRFYDDIAYDDSFNGLVFDVDEGDRLARCLAEKRVLFCGNHGVVVIGRLYAEGGHAKVGRQGDSLDLKCREQYGGGRRFLADGSGRKQRSG